jgi:hypothetical protein
VIAALGKIIEQKGDTVVFAPAHTNYEIHLAAQGVSGAINTLVDGVVRVTARKIWTVPSGGNFVSPAIGTPRTIQGRVRSVGERSIVVQAGFPIVVDFPAIESGFDFATGPLRVGSIVNIMAMPGASFEK